MSQRKHRFFGITARTLMILSAGLLVLAYLSIFVNPAKFWVMTIFGLLYLPLLLLNLTLLVWALIRHSKSFWIPLLAVLPSILIFGRHFQMAPEDVLPSADDVKIVSYNVGRFAAGPSGRAASRDSVFAFLRRQDADIICLQEVFFDHSSTLENEFAGKFGDYHLEYYVYTQPSGVYGNVILSRMPARNKGKVVFEHSANMALYGDYLIGERLFRVYNCHFQSYNISLSGIGKALRRGFGDAVRDTERKMSSSLSLRPKQVDAVIQNIEKSALPCIVTGDFNDTPMSYTYWRLSKGRCDSFMEAGRGFGATYSMLRPLLRIDYILYPELLEAVSHKVFSEIVASDHYPIATSLRPAQK